MGDYYRGDYYRGDPGFFSFLGGIAKKAVGLIPGVGPIASTALEAIGKHAAPAAAGAAAGAGVTAAIKSGAKKVGGFALKHPVLTGAGAAGAGAMIGAGATAMTERLLRGGGRKHRRMNPCNPRALRRALRRAHAFSKFARKAIRVEHRFKKPRGAWPRGHSRKRKR
jgi:hypothetical protein